MGLRARASSTLDVFFKRRTCSQPAPITTNHTKVCKKCAKNNAGWRNACDMTAEMVLENEPNGQPYVLACITVTITVTTAVLYSSYKAAAATTAVAVALAVVLIGCASYL